MPRYEEAATKLVKNDPPIALAKVDCTAETKVCGKFSVTGYPTLKIFKNGEFAEEYNGPRETGYFESETHNLKKDLLKTADQLSEKFRFAYTTAKDILEKAGHK
ncbi:unnamed protein product, partial [Didymodactylos carnosus]